MKLYLPPSLCESTANWQPVITTHLPCSASALRSSLSSEQNRGLFLNWPLGNSIYWKAVAAEFALFSIGFGEIGVKTTDKITKLGILLEPGNQRCLWAEPQRPPTVRYRIECKLRWAGSRTPTPSSCFACSARSTAKTSANQTNWYWHNHRHTFLVQRLSEDLKKLWRLT